MKYKIHFSNSNNALYREYDINCTELEMLKFVNEKLHNKKNKFYNVWIYYLDLYLKDEDNDFYGKFRRSKKIEKLIKYLEEND